MRPAYVISLPGSDRRPVIASHLEAHRIPFCFWNGVRVPADAEGRRRLILAHAPGVDPARVTLTDGTLGCLLSFLGLWRHLALEDGVTLVLEDDVTCNPDVDFAALDLQALADRIGGDYCFLHWYPCRHTGAQAQVVTPRGARLLAEAAQAILERNSPGDLMLWENCPVAELAVGDLYGATKTWLFRHASEYGDARHSERMQINMERNRTFTDLH